MDRAPGRRELASLLKMEDFSSIYAEADRVRKVNVSDVVYIRSILEFSNHCRRQCRYCGLNCTNRKAKRFRMKPEEIVSTARQAWDAGYKTVVLQSGEDPFYTPQLLGELVREIKKTGIQITLSCGEMSFEDYSYLKECGADRYLLKQETADPEIYRALHPDSQLEERISCLKNLKKLGYETGSGFMIGLPGQSLETIAADILLIHEIGCDMAGIGPFIPHPDTPLKNLPHGSTELTKRAVALTRILMPEINLPATTSLGVLDTEEKNSVFFCGANVIMRKITPDAYKKLYEIYPADLGETDIYKERRELEEMIHRLGRIPV